MAKYIVDWLENDKYGNITASLTREDNTKLMSVVLGKEFVGKGVMPGHEIEGKEWVSPKNGKLYLFKEKEEERTAYQYKPVYGANKAKETHPAMEYQKEITKSVAKAQDSKDISVKISSTMRDAVQLALAEYKDENVLDTLEQGIEKWRHYLWVNWDKTDKDFPPFED